jgi:hypothetical protein
MCVSALLGRSVAVPDKWVGTWVLNIEESTFGEVLSPGVPANFAILGQRLTLERSARALRLSGDTVFRDGSGGSHSAHDDNSLNLDGTKTIIGPVSLSFRPIDDSTFEITSKLNISGRNLSEVSRFSFSSDGRTLTETKTQTERAVVTEAADKAIGAVIRTSTSVLVFRKKR